MQLTTKLSAEEIPFDLPKEPRITINTQNDFICIDVDKVGDGYRAIINGHDYELPDYVTNRFDAKQAACRLAAQLANRAIGELLIMAN